MKAINPYHGTPAPPNGMPCLQFDANTTITLLSDEDNTWWQVSSINISQHCFIEFHCYLADGNNSLACPTGCAFDCLCVMLVHCGEITKQIELLFGVKVMTDDDYFALYGIQIHLQKGNCSSRDGMLKVFFISDCVAGSHPSSCWPLVHFV